METNESNESTPQSYTPLESAGTLPARASGKSGNSQLTTALIVIIVVLLFVMLMLSMNGRLFPSKQNDGTGLEALAAENIRLRADANAERARQGLPPLPGDSGSARMMAERIRRDSTSLAGLVGEWQTELETKDAALRDLHSQLSSRDENARRLYTQIAALQSKLDQTDDASGQLQSMSNNLKTAHDQIENYRKQLAELQGRPSSAEVDQLRQQLNQSVETRNKLQLQIDTLLGQAKNKIDKSQLDDAVAELARIRPELNKQRYEIQRLRALLDRARLFVESGKDLPADAARLFAKLRTLDAARGPALAAAYQGIEQTLGARVIHRQTFPTGSSQIAFDRETMIKNAVSKGAAPDSFFLVVGYASKTGDSASNQALSAARATTAASVVDLLKTGQQQVRAVYLGQTDRFSADNPAENQICEVWEIRK